MSRDLLAMLLGPPGAELGCDECFESLDAHVESELRSHATGQEAQGMQAHLDGCPACREEYESLRELARAG